LCLSVVLFPDYHPGYGCLELAVL